MSWWLIIPENLAAGPWDEFYSVLDLTNHVIIHVLPLLFSTINLFVLSDMIIYIQDLWLVPVLATTYLSIAYVYSTVEDYEIYSFLTFKNMTSFWVGLGIVVASWAVHSGNAMLT